MVHDLDGFSFNMERARLLASIDLFDLHVPTRRSPP